MARDRANIRLDMWGDTDWRSLTPEAQWLYMLLLTHPKTNRVGVCEWHPGRLAAMSSGMTKARVAGAAEELQARWFVVVDEDTDEVLIRSYVKYDGVLAQPNLAVTMANDWSGVASHRIRGVVAFEVQRMRERKPDLGAWKKVEKLDTLLSADGINVRDADPSVDPTPDPSVDPSDDPKVGSGAKGERTTTATSTTTNASHSGRARTIPSKWSPTSEHMAYAKEHRLDLVAEAEAFKLHAEANGRTLVNWNAGFSQWLRKAKPKNVTAIKPTVPLSEEWRMR